VGEKGIKAVKFQVCFQAKFLKGEGEKITLQLKMKTAK